MPKGDKLKFKADPDDGTTPIANLLLEALAIANLSGKEKGAIAYLWRRTYGWNDPATGARLKERDIALKEWAIALRTPENHASSILTGLCNKKIFKRHFLGPGKGYIYRMNTNISSWNSSSIDIQGLQILVTLQQKCKGYTDVEVTLPENGKGTLPENGNPPKAKSGTIKESINKVLNKGAPTKKKYGEGQNVLLAENEYNKLVQKFGQAGAATRIEKLSCYIASTGKKYKSHYFTILNWSYKDDVKGGHHGGNKPPPGNSKPLKYIDADTGELVDDDY